MRKWQVEDKNKEDNKSKRIHNRVFYFTFFSFLVFELAEVYKSGKVATFSSKQKQIAIAVQ